jgi:hypothetical protein
MGLDMYLEGRTYLWQNHKEPEKTRTKDGFRLKGETIELGYWRKHPNLHGFIVQTFAGGKDECQDIELSMEQLQQIIEAVRTNALPTTRGFFFGESDGSETEETIQILTKALEWMSAGTPSVESRDVVYRASW